MSITFLLAEEVTAAIQAAIKDISTTPGSGLTEVEVKALIATSFSNLANDLSNGFVEVQSKINQINESINNLTNNLASLRDIVNQNEERLNSLFTSVASYVIRLQSDEDRILASESKYNQVFDSLTGLVNNLETFKSTINAALADRMTSSAVATLISDALANYDPDTYAIAITAGECPAVDVVWVKQRVADLIVNPCSNLNLKFQTFVQDGEGFQLQATNGQTIRGGKISVSKNSDANVPNMVRLMRNPTQLTQWVRT